MICAAKGILWQASQEFYGSLHLSVGWGKEDDPWLLQLGTAEKPAGAVNIPLFALPPSGRCEPGGQSTQTAGCLHRRLPGFPWVSPTAGVRNVTAKHYDMAPSLWPRAIRNDLPAPARPDPNLFPADLSGF